MTLEGLFQRFASSPVRLCESLRAFLDRAGSPCPVRCTKRFYNSFCKLFDLEVSSGGFSNVSTLLEALQFVAKGSHTPSTGFSKLLSFGLPDKMVVWCDGMCRESPQPSGEEWSKAVDDLLFTVSVALDHSDGVKRTLVVLIPSLLHCICSASLPCVARIEATRASNALLEVCGVEYKHRLSVREEIKDAVNGMGRLIVAAGDFELQVAMVECVFRITTGQERDRLARLWFPHLHQTFTAIQEGEFETDCRDFLNRLNERAGQKRSVHSLPCKKAVLGSFELRRPSDGGLKAFWVDFNCVSQSLSLFVEDPSGEEGEGMWETVVVRTALVSKYHLRVESGDFVLTVTLTEPAHSLLPSLSPSPSHTITITFPTPHDPTLPLQRAFPGKQQQIRTQTQISPTSSMKSSIAITPLRIRTAPLSTSSNPCTGKLASTVATNTQRPGMEISPIEPPPNTPFVGGHLNSQDSATPPHQTIPLPVPHTSTPKPRPQLQFVSGGAARTLKTSQAIASIQIRGTRKLEENRPAVHSSTRVTRQPSDSTTAPAPGSRGRGTNGGRPQEATNIQRPQTDSTHTPNTTDEGPLQPQSGDRERRRNTETVPSTTRGRRKEEETTGEPGPTAVSRIALKGDEGSAGRPRIALKGDEGSAGRPRKGDEGSAGRPRKGDEGSAGRPRKGDERAEESAGRPRRGVGERRKGQDADLSRSHAPSGLRDITNNLNASRAGQKRVFNLSSAPARSKTSRAKQQPAAKSKAPASKQHPPKFTHTTDLNISASPVHSRSFNSSTSSSDLDAIPDSMPQNSPKRLRARLTVPPVEEDSFCFDSDRDSDRSWEVKKPPQRGGGRSSAKTLLTNGRTQRGRGRGGKGAESGANSGAKEQKRDVTPTKNKISKPSAPPSKNKIEHTTSKPSAAPSKNKIEHTTSKPSAPPSKNKIEHATSKPSAPPSKNKIEHATSKPSAPPSKNKIEHATSKPSAPPSKNKIEHTTSKPSAPPSKNKIEHTTSKPSAPPSKTRGRKQPPTVADKGRSVTVEWDSPTASEREAEPSPFPSESPVDDGEGRAPEEELSQQDDGLVEEPAAKRASHGRREEAVKKALPSSSPPASPPKRPSLGKRARIVAGGRGLEEAPPTGGKRKRLARLSSGYFSLPSASPASSLHNTPTAKTPVPPTPHHPHPPSPSSIHSSQVEADPNLTIGFEQICKALLSKAGGKSTASKPTPTTAAPDDVVSESPAGTSEGEGSPQLSPHITLTQLSKQIVQDSRSHQPPTSRRGRGKKTGSSPQRQKRKPLAITTTPTPRVKPKGPAPKIKTPHIKTPHIVTPHIKTPQLEDLDLSLHSSEPSDTPDHAKTNPRKRKFSQASEEEDLSPESEHLPLLNWKPSLVGGSHRSVAQDDPLNVSSEIRAMMTQFNTGLSNAAKHKYARLENVAASSSKASCGQLVRVWAQQQKQRSEVLTTFREQLCQELEVLEGDIRETQHCEEQASVHFKKQLQALVASLRTQQKQVGRLKALQLSFHEQLGVLEHQQTKQQKATVQKSLKDDMQKMQKKLLGDSQRQEMKRVRQALQVMLMQV